MLHTSVASKELQSIQSLQEQSILNLGVVDYSPRKKREINRFLKQVQRDSDDRRIRLRQFQEKQRKHKQQLLLQEKEQERLKNIEANISKRQKIKMHLQTIDQNRAARQQEHKEFLEKLRKLKKINPAAKFERQRVQSVELKPRQPVPDHSDLLKNYEEQVRLFQQKQEQKRLQEQLARNKTMPKKVKKQTTRFHRLLKQQKQKESLSIEANRLRVNKSKLYAQELRVKMLQDYRSNASLNSQRRSLDNRQADNISRRIRSQSMDARKLGNIYLSRLRQMPKKMDESHSQQPDDNKNSEYSSKLENMRKAKIVNYQPIVSQSNPLYGHSHQTQRLPKSAEEAQMIVQRLKRRDRELYAKGHRSRNLGEEQEVSKIIIGSIEEKLNLLRYMSNE